MYNKSAYYYDAFCKHKNYFTASETLREIILQNLPHAQTLLDIACGTGGHLQYLQNHFNVEGLDMSPDMLTLAAQKCPDLSFHQGDLVTFNLQKKFDVITCLFGSVAYCRNMAGLEKAVTTMLSHLNDEGILILEPWITLDRYKEGKIVFDWIDEPLLKISRMYINRLRENMSVFDIEYLAATPKGVDRFSETHELGLFQYEQYDSTLRKAGLEVAFHESGPFGYGLFICVRQSWFSSLC